MWHETNDLAYSIIRVIAIYKELTKSDEEICFFFDRPVDIILLTRECVEWLSF
jgi:hypothetical protein